MIVLPEPPRLRTPSVDVRVSYLVGEQADMVHRGEDAVWLDEASRDFSTYVAERTGVVQRWGVPSTLYWFTSGEFYLGSLVIRHQLLADELGGHIGYHVVKPWQGQGHATTMLAQALEICADAGMERVLLTVDPANQASTTVVRRNGGVRDSEGVNSTGLNSEGLNSEGEARWWITTAPRRPLRV